MTKLTRAALVAVAATLVSGCAVVAGPQASFAPETEPAMVMPSVTVTGPAVEYTPMSADEIRDLEAGSVSGAVHELTLHGYDDIAVVAEGGAEVPQHEWDAHRVVRLTLTDREARIVVG